MSDVKEMAYISGGLVAIATSEEAVRHVLGCKTEESIAYAECSGVVIPRARLEELCTLFKDGLIEDGEEEAYTYFRETCELSDAEADWLGLEHWQSDEEDFDDSAAWEDDSDRGCKDCPPEECTGHCMSCHYRPV